MACDSAGRNLPTDPPIDRWTIESRRKRAAWFRYWEAVRKICFQEGCGSFQDARNKLHARVDITKVKGNWADDRVLSFMRLLSGRVRQSDARISDALEQRGILAQWDALPADATLMECVAATPTSESGRLCFWLAKGGLKNVSRLAILETLFDDPIYGYTAKFEHQSHLSSLQYKADEEKRQAGLHPNLRRLQKIGNSFPFIVSLHFPWNHPNAPVQGTLTVLNDGFPAFRLMPVDPETMDRFRVVQICDPDSRWFLFDEHNIVQDREMTLDDVVAFLEASRDANFARYNERAKS